MTATEMVIENKRRNDAIRATFNPLTGEGAPLERALLSIPDFSIPEQYVPVAMFDDAFIRDINGKSLQQYLTDKSIFPTDADYHDNLERLKRELIRTRIRYDFCFWAVLFVFIKPKAGGDDIRFVPNRAQRKLLCEMERLRLDGKPIHIILLKARQWGGSTLVQLYMAWIQLVHKKSWNSIVVAHLNSAAVEVKGMFTKLIEHYPLWLLYDEGEEYSEKARKIGSFEGSQSIDYVPARNFKIKVGSAQSPNTARGADTSMTHCTEVAFWVHTDGKSPEEIVRSACSGKRFAPLELEIFESTANGMGNFFHTEYMRAKMGESDKVPVFVAWHEIDMYSLPLEEEPTSYAQRLLDNKGHTDPTAVVDGAFLYRLWTMGATLEAIHWYTKIAPKYTSHAALASEYPSDDIEAFAHSGTPVFNLYDLDVMRANCKKPIFIGDIEGEGTEGEAAKRNIKVRENKNGCMSIWAMPDTAINVRHRYLVTVDIGGTSGTADYSDILVIDRYWMKEGDPPEVVAEWHGHIRHDQLAWLAVTIATYYCHALLVFESNTLETKDRERGLDGNQAPYILDLVSEHYDNLYAREGDPENIRDSKYTKWGFHVNIGTKPGLISNIVKHVEEKGYIERCHEAIDEMAIYEKRKDGSWGNAAGGERDRRHDDRVMVRAIALFVSLHHMPLPEEYVKEDEDKYVASIINRPVNQATI